MQTKPGLMQAELRGICLSCRQTSRKAQWQNLNQDEKYKTKNSIARLEVVNEIWGEGANKQETNVVGVGRI